MLIYKYQLNMAPLTKIMLPRTAKVLSAKVQRGVICVWVAGEFDSIEKELAEWHFAIVATGGDIFESFNARGNFEPKFIDTVFFNDGEFVFHVFAHCP